MTQTVAVAVKDLRKRYGSVYAVDGVSFEVRAGEIFSLLGPNGAGKTTTISILSGLLPFDSGEVYVMGHSVRKDPRRVKAEIGVVPQEIAVYEDLSARENLDFWGQMYGLSGVQLKKRVAEALDLAGLAEFKGLRVGKYSGGMKRRLNVAVALLHQPRVLIMDEPTVGIDPQSRRSILDSVKSLHQAGAAVLYTTHYMEEAQEISDRIAIVDHGRMVAEGTHADLIRLVGGQARIELCTSRPGEDLLAGWNEIAGVGKAFAENGRLTVLAQDSNRILPRLFEVAARVGAQITSVDVREPNLEAVFLHLTGRALRDGGEAQ